MQMQKCAGFYNVQVSDRVRRRCISGVWRAGRWGTYLGLEGDEGAENADDTQRCNGGTGRYLVGRSVASIEVVSRGKERPGKGRRDLFGEALSVVGLDMFSDDLHHARRYVRETQLGVRVCVHHTDALCCVHIHLRSANE